LLELKLEKVKLMEERIRLKEGLPFKYGFKKYGWQKSYCDSKKSRHRLICAANQIGKSTIQICDRIDVATSPDLWPKLWPRQFKYGTAVKPFSWYLYPNQDTVMSEFVEKWVPYYLPRGEFKDHPVFGWKEQITNKVLKHITFNSGWRIYFKTYGQNVQDLQSGTVWAIDCDEELPEDLLSELEARLFATDGYFSMAFTATLGQEIWRKAIEGEGDDEIYPDAWKKQISMFDCLQYSDGADTPWTKDRIEQIIRGCKSANEVKRRVYGKFVVDSGLKYPGFTRELNYVERPKSKEGKVFTGPPKGWSVYSAVDVGSGGKHNHPAAYIFLAANPKLTKIRAFKGRRLDGIETTAGDILKFYTNDKGVIQTTIQAYDSAAKDFGTIANRMGLGFTKAKKDHAIGELALNTAFKSGILKIYKDDEEMIKLVRELETLLVTTAKNKSKDDFIDALRYALMEIPIDWEEVLENGEIKIDKKVNLPDKNDRRAMYEYWDSEEFRKENEDEIENEFEFWGDLYGN